MNYYNRLPYALMGGGFLLGGIMLGEILATAALPNHPFSVPVVANYVSSLPFVVALVAGGYWLLDEDFGRAEFRRIAAWVVVGFTFFLLFAFLAVIGQDSWIARIGIMRWGASIGAGAGMLVGLSEAKAIKRFVRAERARMRSNELERKNERLEEFANILAHDLRNPLNVAGGRLELANEEYDDDHLDVVASALERMNQIIDMTLRLARSGRVIDEPEPVVLSDVADRCWNNVPTAQATLDIESSATIRADPDRLQHLFENLFRNAVEHGGTAVTVRVGTHPDGFYVEDDGPGIPEDELDTVLQAGYSTSADGTGFGLAIVDQIVDAHGWKLGVTESAAGGVRFEITGVSTGSTAPPTAPSALA